MHKAERNCKKIENWFKRFKSKNKDRRLILYVNEEMDNYDFWLGFGDIEYLDITIYIDYSIKLHLIKK